MQKALHETCEQYVARRLSEGWKIISQDGFNIVLQSPDGDMRPIDLRNDILTLRPNAAGDSTTIPYQEPDSTFHWDKVDEVIPDDGTTFVYLYVDGGTSGIDLYNLEDTIQTGKINSIRVYARFWLYYSYPTSMVRIQIKTGGVDYYFAITENIGYWSTYSNLWATNPQTGIAWTWANINNLQAGIWMQDTTVTHTIRCTQVYVEVDYSKAAAPSSIVPLMMTLLEEDVI